MSHARDAWLRWGGSFGVVLSVHLMMGLGVLAWMRLSSSAVDTMAPDALMVELAPAPEAPAAAPTELPAGPRQPEQVQQVIKPASTVHTPVKKVRHEDPEVQDPDQHEESTEVAEASEMAADASRAQAPPSVNAAPSQRYAAQQTVSGTPGQAAASWQAVLLGHLEQHRRYPRQAERLRQEGVGYVRFAVDRQGHVSNPRIARSSGHAVLDQETLATVRRATPVPAPPADLAPFPVDVMVPVEFFLQRR